MPDLKKRTIVFDGQVFQSTAWDRGMGKYSFNFLLSLSKSKEFKYDKIVILFSKNIELQEEVTENIKKLGDKFTVKKLNLQVPKIVPGEDINALEKKNKLVIENYIDSIGTKPVDFVILSLMIDQYAAVFPENARKVLLFYDLIPLQYSERYGKMWTYNNYLNRINSIFQADLIFTISETVSDDLVVFTGLNESNIISLVGGAIDRKNLKSKKPKKVNKLEKFILMPSGNDLRKNNFKAVQAFEKFRKDKANHGVKLLITSHFDEKTKGDLLSISKEVVFTGNVSEAELKWLYENMQLLLFVSEYEGLGLPILEAVEVGKPIVCSNLTVFNEMSEDAFYYSDENNTASMAYSIDLAMKHKDFAIKKDKYQEILNKYTWENTADQIVNALTTQPDTKPNLKKPKIAIFTPNPASYSAVGKVVMLCHYEMSRHFDIDYFIESPRSKKASLRKSFLDGVGNKVEDARRFTAKRYGEYMAVLYHIGNSEMHIDSIKNALHLPGYLFIHDTRLNEVFEHELKKYSYISDDRLIAEKELESLVSSERASYLTSLVNASLGVFTHSDYAKQAIKSINIEEASVHRLEIPVGTPKRDKQKIGNTFSVGFGGIIHKDKGLNLIDKISRTSELNEVEISLFGIPLAEPGEIDRLNSYTNVSIRENLTDFQFKNVLTAMDAIISFRPNYNGETSLTVIEALCHGVVPIVRDIGWFSELPDTIVCKTNSEAEVVDALIELAQDGQLLSRMQKAGKAYAKKHFNYQSYARKIKESVQNVNHQSLNFKVAKLIQSGASKERIKTAINNIR